MSGTKVTKTRDAYRRPEDPTDLITYAIAACVAFVGLVFLLLKTDKGDALSVCAAALCGAVTFIVFLSGLLATALPHGNRLRTVAAGFSRCEKTLLAFAAMTPLLLIGLGRGGQTDEVLSYVLFAIIAAAAVADVLVNLIEASESKLIELALYVIIGLASVAGLDDVYSLCGDNCFWIMLGGFGMYLIGTVAFAIGGTPGRIINRLFVIGGAALNFVGIYSFLL